MSPGGTLAEVEGPRSRGQPVWRYGRRQMIDAITHHAVGARPLESGATRPRRLPIGFGLLLGATLSLSLWGAVGWTAVKLLSAG